MNIFVLDLDPAVAARMHCDKHVPKMCVEAAQMMASALRRHGATDEQMPLTKSGTPYKGGYAHHPCTVWAGESRDNFDWLADHAHKLLCEYYERFGKEHACTMPVMQMYNMDEMIPEGKLTPFALAMPDEYRPRGSSDDVLYMEAKGDDAVKAYQAYYHSKQFAKWEKGTPAPDWWQGVEVTA
tara:strand:- start:1724 stop:2272 length:549 start_codon:yes stop_codon:yes gene_type:complete